MKEQFLVFIVVLIWVVNFAISWWNARVTGLVWSEAKKIGGWIRFMNWMGAIMSASGFTWCYLIVLMFGAYYLQPLFIKPDQPLILTIDAVQAGLSLGYLIIIPGILFSGFMIWIDSLVRAWVTKSATNIGVAGWNTFAQAHNTYRAMKGMPEAWKSVSKFFTSSKGGDSKGKAIVLLLFLVIIAILGGILTTWAIINKYAGTRELPVKEGYSMKREYPSSFQERLKQMAEKNTNK